jgi:hypothetical protein
MMKKEKIIYEFWGECQIITDLSLEELANILSKEIFANAKFVKGERSIWEEIPSVYIESSFFGMLVILGGYGGEEGYTVSVSPYGEFSRYINSENLGDFNIKIDLNFHIYNILSQALKNNEELRIIKPTIS